MKRRPVFCILLLSFRVLLADLVRSEQQEEPTLSPEVDNLFEEISKHGCHLKQVGFFDPISRFNWRNTMYAMSCTLEKEKLVPFVGTASPFVMIRTVSLSNNYIARLVRRSGIFESGLIVERLGNMVDEMEVRVHGQIGFYRKDSNESVVAAVLFGLPLPAPRPEELTTTLLRISLTVYES